MDISTINPPPTPGATLHDPPIFYLKNSGSNDAKLREVFTQFVGESFFGEMIKAMQSTVGKPAYFHGGRAEEVFQEQLNQALSEHLTEASADKFANPLFRQQFPQIAARMEPQPAAPPNGLFELDQLPRR